jgi:hypothetical protein
MVISSNWFIGFDSVQFVFYLFDLCSLLKRTKSMGWKHQISPSELKHSNADLHLFHESVAYFRV